MMAECDAYPDAECVANYCGGCFADFYMGGEKVDCDKPPVTCEWDGAIYQVGDEFNGVGGNWCNTCFCSDDGTINCTKMGCADCPPPVEYEGGCTAVVAWGKNPDTGACCQYATPCNVPANFEIFYSKDECNSGCSEVMCTLFCEYGFKVDDNGCQMCACNEPPPGDCTPGDTKDADDGCNTCVCSNNGMWNCTKMACECSCPEPMGFGMCVEMCMSDEDCGIGEMCCSNGCGHTCQKAICEGATETASPCEACIGSGGTWQPGAGCTTNCGVMDLACYTKSCPAPCSKESCDTCFSDTDCESAGCKWNQSGPAMWCTNG